MKKGKWSTSLICAVWIGMLFIFTSTVVYADVPQYLSFQGKLLEDGSAVTGYRNVTFSIWNIPSGGDPTSALWHESQVVHIIDGIYNVQLGAITSLPGDLHTYANLYLQVDVVHPSQGSQRLTPLMPFNSNVFTIKAAVADSAASSAYATTAGTATTAGSATNADHATTADSATTATNADHATTADIATTAASATNAGDADTLDGQHASDFYTQAQVDSIVSDLEARIDLLNNNSYNIDFGTYYGTPADTYGAASGSIGLWAKVGLGKTPVTDIWGVKHTHIEVVAGADDGWYGSSTNDDELLLDDNFYSSGGNTWEVTMSPLPNGNYDLYVYAPMHPSVPTGDMIINGGAVTGIPGNITTLVEGTSYIVVPITVTGNTLTISGSDPGSYAGLSGIQLSPR